MAPPSPPRARGTAPRPPLPSTPTDATPPDPVPPSEGLLADYAAGPHFCELTGDRGTDAAMLRTLLARIDGLDPGDVRRRARAVGRDLYNLGNTFTVYTERDAIDRILPFDVIPRVILPAEWQRLEAGVIQRVTALNLFLDDLYHDQKILKDRILPPDMILGHRQFRREMVGFPVKFGTWSHITGIDIVRDGEGTFRVLEDNARTPSGVSYVVEGRTMMWRAFADLMADLPLRPVDDYGDRLHAAMVALAPEGVSDPQVVLLSPGIYNSAYFEHVFLAREMGVPLVQGQDLCVEDDRVFMRTTSGLAPVHTIYRRIDDDFLDPEVFRRDSMLGVPGLMRAWKAGRVAIANAVGTGVADDKAVYAYMPRIIRYYLDQEPIIPNVDTRICREPEALAYTLEHLAELVVKPVGESGGYGMIIGPRATRRELAEFRRRLKADPANYISQPTLGLSVCPTMTPRGIQPRHVDLRPFAVTARDTWVLPGGLTRVALKRGSLVVNSSQGGGSKDTWVLAEG